MKLKSQVTSVALSNKLHVLGVTDPSMFYREWQGAREDEIEMNKIPDYCPDTVNCYTVAELGEMLPSQNKDGNLLYIWKDDSGAWRVTYTLWGILKEFEIEKETNEADARAKMLIYLIENKLITL